MIRSARPDSATRHASPRTSAHARVADSSAGTARSRGTELVLAAAQRDQPQVGSLAEDVAAAVVDGEQGAARQRRQRLVGAQRVVEGVHQLRDVIEPADAAGHGRLQDVAHAIVGGVGEHPRFLGGVGEARHVADAADLHVAAGGEVDVAVTETLGEIGEYGEPRRGQGSAGEAQSPDRAVGGDVHAAGAGAAVRAVAFGAG